MEKNCSVKNQEKGFFLFRGVFCEMKLKKKCVFVKYSAQGLLKDIEDSIQFG